ncbi:MAG: shikimate dehydrogenase [Eubacterium sp.]|nr:shikimate dehydrogenase [Eubacterium sp.]
MKQYAIIGHPIGHTLSPPIHRRLFELVGVTDFEYLIKDIPPERLEDSFAELKTLAGFNITIPHKINIIKMCDELDDSAKRYNSVNCISVGEKTVGYNTDCVGFNLTVKMLGADNAQRVMLLGCGGVGRMAAIETVLRNAKLTVAVRPDDVPVAKALCEELNALKPDSADYCLLADASGEYDLIVNATPVGMSPNIDASPLGDEALARISAGCFFDLIYNPGETKLMKLMKAKGAKVCGGMNMLVWQAVAAHEIWDGSSYDLADIEQLVRDMEALV